MIWLILHSDGLTSIVHCKNVQKFTLWGYKRGSFDFKSASPNSFQMCNVLVLFDWVLTPVWQFRHTAAHHKSVIRSARVEQRKREKQPVSWYLKNNMTASLCYLVMFSFLSFAPITKHSNTADQPKHTTGRGGICAFIGNTEAPFGKKKLCCVLSSCLANTQLYMEAQ